MKLATREDPVKNKIPVWMGEYNELMNCQVKDQLVSRLIALNNKLNLLSPDLVHGDEERAEVQLASTGIAGLSRKRCLMFWVGLRSLLKLWSWFWSGSIPSSMQVLSHHHQRRLSRSFVLKAVRLNFCL